MVTRDISASVMCMYFICSTSLVRLDLCCEAHNNWFFICWWHITFELLRAVCVVDSSRPGVVPWQSSSSDTESYSKDDKVTLQPWRPIEKLSPQSSVDDLLLLWTKTISDHIVAAVAWSCSLHDVPSTWCCSNCPSWYLAAYCWVQHLFQCCYTFDSLIDDVLYFVKSFHHTECYVLLVLS